MAAKVLFFLAAIAAIAYAVDVDCNCESEPDDTALWEFLKKLSSDYADEKDLSNDHPDAVLPGELSPLLDCNCLDKTKERRKRKILPEVVESTEVEYNDDEPQYELKRTPKCPEGYNWFGIMCVDTKLVMDK